MPRTYTKDNSHDSLPKEEQYFHTGYWLLIFTYTCVFIWPDSYNLSTLYL